MLLPPQNLPMDLIPDAGCPGLPVGHKLLQGQYQIEAGLSEGGFGRTYLARDSLDRRVVIKECLPEGTCSRAPSGACLPNTGCEKIFRGLLRSFLREAKLLARAGHSGADQSEAGHSGIVRVHQVFRENNTAYIAMDHVPGHDLHTVRIAKGMCLGSAELIEIARQALDTLRVLHGLGILHRDIAPDNLLWDSPAAGVAGATLGRLTLIDFGAAHVLDEDQTKAPVTVKDGFSAPELYDPAAPHSPAVDLYSLGATLELLITGEAPPSAEQRLSACAAGLTDPRRDLAAGPWPLARSVLESIDTALALSPTARFPSAQAWLAVLPAGVDRLSVPATPADAAAKVASDTSEPLQRRIAALVAETNTGLTPLLPRALLPKVPPPPPPRAPRPLVDMFGDPIDDLERWLLEQDRRPKRKKAVAPQPDLPQPPSFQQRLNRLKERTS